MLPQEAIKEFKQLYKRHFGVDLNDAEASFRAHNLINLYGLVYSVESTAQENIPSPEHSL